MDYEKRRRIALKVMLSVFIISVILLFIGNQIFSVFGITLNSFRIGTGALLFLSAKSLVQGMTLWK
jgi:multiple antibiotic resistance protein